MSIYFINSIFVLDMPTFENYTHTMHNIIAITNLLKYTVAEINDDVRRRGENAKQWQTAPKSSNVDDSNSVSIKSDKTPIRRKSNKNSKTQLKLPSTKAKSPPVLPNSITTNADVPLDTPSPSNSTRVKSPRPNKNDLAARMNTSVATSTTTAHLAKATASTTVTTVVPKARTSSSKSSTKARSSKRGVKSNVDNTAAATRVGSVSEDTIAWQFQVGDRVEAKYQGRGRRWYKGTIVNILQNGGSYDIDYDDGDRDRSLNQVCTICCIPYHIILPSFVELNTLFVFLSIIRSLLEGRRHQAKQNLPQQL